MSKTIKMSGCIRPSAQQDLSNNERKQPLEGSTRPVTQECRWPANLRQKMKMVAEKTR